MNNFWQTSKLPKLQRLQDKSNAVQEWSLWEALLNLARTGLPQWPRDACDVGTAPLALPSFTPWENAKLRKTYELVGFLGSGSGGSGYRAVNRYTEETVAVKVTSARLLCGGVFELGTAMEVPLLMRCQSPNVVKILDAFTSVALSVHVMEMAMSTLQEYARGKPGKPGPVWMRSLSLQMFEALVVLDDKQVVHGDVDASNILVQSTNPLVVKLADFGQAVLQDRTSANFPTIMKNPSYAFDVRPPEFWFAPEGRWEGQGVTYAFGVRANGFAADVWAMGAVMVAVAMKTSMGDVMAPSHGPNEVAAVRHLLAFLASSKSEVTRIANGMNWVLPPGLLDSLPQYGSKETWQYVCPWATRVLVLCPTRRSRAAEVRDLLIKVDLRFQK